MRVHVCDVCSCPGMSEEVLDPWNWIYKVLRSSTRAVPLNYHCIPFHIFNTFHSNGSENQLLHHNGILPGSCRLGKTIMHLWVLGSNPRDSNISSLQPLRTEYFLHALISSEPRQYSTVLFTQVAARDYSLV